EISAQFGYVSPRCRRSNKVFDVFRLFFITLSEKNQNLQIWVILKSQSVKNFR
ncbi:MAG: hypothetical protein RL688_900, partial [Actinomycetota bacterium]